MTPTGKSSRGFTLLEVLIVLVLMGVASALVAPALRGVGGARISVTSLSVRAQRAAIARAEALQLRVDESGAWSLRVARTRDVLDSGHVQPDSLRAHGVWVYDALGGCLPVASEVSSAPFDALACRTSTSGAAAP